MATLSEVFSNIANAIRNKTGKTATMTPAEMATAIDGLSDTSADTVTAGAMLSGTTAHDKSGTKITGTIATKTATTYTPSTSNQTIDAGTYCSGVQTIKGDSNLVAGNIKSGVSIFGVNGSYEGNAGGGTSIAEWIYCNELPTTYVAVDGGGENSIIVYLELTDNMEAVYFRISGNRGLAFIALNDSMQHWNEYVSDLDIDIDFVSDSDGYYCKIKFSKNEQVYALPIYKRT